jgi:hypothetical protein
MIKIKPYNADEIPIIRRTLLLAGLFPELGRGHSVESKGMKNSI